MAAILSVVGRPGSFGVRLSVVVLPGLLGGVERDGTQAAVYIAADRSIAGWGGARMRRVAISGRRGNRAVIAWMQRLRTKEKILFIFVSIMIRVINAVAMER